MVLPAHQAYQLGEQGADHHQHQQGHQEAEKRPAHLDGLEYPVAANQQHQHDEPDHDVERAQAAQGPDAAPQGIVGQWAIEGVEQPFVERHAKGLANGP
ncbi:hypothetical protein D3C77_684360 [compost metagenome]